MPLIRQISMCVLGAVLALLPAALSAQSVSDASRLARAAAPLMPLGKVLEDAATADPVWPFTENPGDVDAAQLACVRGNLREPQFLAFMEERAADYIRAHPDRVVDDIALLEGGGGKLFARLISEGIAAGSAKREMDLGAVMGQAQPGDLTAMLALSSEPRYQPVRELIGINQAMNGGESSKAAGESAALTFVLPMLMNAMTTCNVPVSALTK